MTTNAYGNAPALSAEVFRAISGRAAIERVRAAGYGAIGLPAWRKDFDPQTLGTSGARDLSVYLARLSLAVSWLSSGGKGRFAVSATLEEDVDRLRAIIGLAGRLRAPSMPRIAVTAVVGALGNKDSAAAGNARTAIDALAGEADLMGVVLALAASQGEDALLDELLAGFPDAPAGRSIDPGAILFAGADPVAVATRIPRIAAVRASDSSAERTNLAPGKGRVPWWDFLAALGARDYHGSVTVEFAGQADAAERAAAALRALGRGPDV